VFERKSKSHIEVFCGGGGQKETKMLGLFGKTYVNRKRRVAFGIRSIDLFNKALLVKWKWRMMCPLRLAFGRMFWN